MLLNRKVLITAGLVVVASGAAFGIYRVASRESPPAFRFTTVSRGAIQALVSATGTLQAVTTVSVGTQVSGQISELLVDFNDAREEGAASRPDRSDDRAAGGGRRPGESRKGPGAGEPGPERPEPEPGALRAPGSSRGAPSSRGDRRSRWPTPR